VTRLIRTLTVILGVLLAIGGGAFVLVRANSGAGANSRAAAVVTPRPEPETASSGSVATSVPGSTAAPSTAAATTGPTTTMATTTTLPLSPQAALSASLDAALAGTNSCLSVEDGLGRVLYQHRPDTALIPASTQKLLVAAAALGTLGPNFRFTTEVMAPARPAKGKVAALWLVGGGDPLLAAPEFVASTGGKARVAGYPWTPLTSLADSLAAAGITLVTGGIRGDDSHEDQLRFLPVWPALYQQQNQIGLLSALSVNEGIQFTPPKSPLAQDPPAYAASELARLLQQRKVAVGSQPDGVAPAGALVVASVSSAPLSQIVEAMLRASDNWIAELLVRAIDKASGGRGTTAGGTATVLRYAARSGLPLNGVHMDDGSGLSRTDQATCRELLAALDLSDQAPYSPMYDGLAVAAQTGTLALRYRGTPLAGNLRAKTGSLDNAAGMVGVVTAPTTLRFAFLDNDSATETALYGREDAVVSALAAYRGGR
jgi:D-alanyl-D-alanine carboxypeptidase/D-alanyl-D-alanine-endopeptidase (penicillin-binding protein 4)